MAEQNELTTEEAQQLKIEEAKKAAAQKRQAEFKYMGDDGGRWLFEQRSDGLCFTIDKPRGVTLDAKTRPLSCRLTVRGMKFNPEVLKIARR